MNSENFNIDLDEAISFLIVELARLQAQIIETHGLISVYWKLNSPETFELADQALSKQSEQRVQQCLQSLVERMSIQSNDLELMIKDLIKKR